MQFADSLLWILGAARDAVVVATVLVTVVMGVIGAGRSVSSYKHLSLQDQETRKSG